MSFAAIRACLGTRAAGRAACASPFPQPALARAARAAEHGEVGGAVVAALRQRHAVVDGRCGRRAQPGQSQPPWPSVVATRGRAAQSLSRAPKLGQRLVTSQCAKRLPGYPFFLSAGGDAHCEQEDEKGFIKILMNIRRDVRKKGVGHRELDYAIEVLRRRDDRRADDRLVPQELIRDPDGVLTHPSRSPFGRYARLDGKPAGDTPIGRNELTRVDHCGIH